MVLWMEKELNKDFQDLLTLDELSDSDFDKIIDNAIAMKQDAKKGVFEPFLKNKSMAMIFQKPSTRTRLSFEIAMSQLGGIAINLSSHELQLARGETIEDTSKTLSRYVDVIMARVNTHREIELLAENAHVPVINGLSDAFHPCQTLADLMTVKEKKSSFKNLKIAWIGDGNNVCSSLLYGCAKSRVSISVATPPGYEPDKNVIEQVRGLTCVELSNEPDVAIRNADVVMTDTFVSMHHEYTDRSKDFLPKFQVNSSIIQKAKKDAIFLHCLPAKRGQEVSNEVIDGSQSVVWDQAENRLHVQKSLLLHLLKV